MPWAIIFMGDDFTFTKFALLEMFVFIAILVVGYYYAWRKWSIRMGLASGCLFVISWIVSLTDQTHDPRNDTKGTKDKYTKQDRAEIGNNIWQSMKKDLF